jgi:hypothetical protein
VYIYVLFYSHCYTITIVLSIYTRGTPVTYTFPGGTWRIKGWEPLPYSIDKLPATLEHCCNMPTCPNSIHNQLSHELPLTGKGFLLSMCSCVWTENSVPTTLPIINSEWAQAREPNPWRQKKKIHSYSSKFYHVIKGMLWNGDSKTIYEYEFGFE